MTPVTDLSQLMVHSTAVMKKVKHLSDLFQAILVKGPDFTHQDRRAEIPVTVVGEKGAA